MCFKLIAASIWCRNAVVAVSRTATVASGALSVGPPPNFAKYRKGLMTPHPVVTVQVVAFFAFHGI